MKCVYDPTEQKKLCNALIDAFIEISQRPAHGRTLLRLMHKLGWRTKFSFLAAAIKHESFREESEWRLVVAPEQGHGIQFRPGRFGVVPYLEIPLASADQNVPVAELVIGPSDDKHASLLGAETIMENLARRHLDPNLRLSRIPQGPPRIASPNEKNYVISMSTTPYRN